MNQLEAIQKSFGEYQKYFSKKIKRYTAKDIVWLNHRQEESGERECSICRRTDHLKENDQCEICWGLEQMAVKMMSNNFFVISKEHEETSYHCQEIVI